MKLVYFPKRMYLVKDISQDFHCSEGIVTKQDLQSASGSTFTTKTGVEGTVVDPSFIDKFAKLPRLAQIMLPKDISWILGATGVGPKSIVVDAGSGSGACASFLSRYVKKVHSFDIREDHLARAQKNADFLECTNITFHHGDVAEAQLKNIDLFILDVPNPASAAEAAYRCLSPGGFVVLYQPHMHQIQQVLNAYVDFKHIKSVELIEREWVVDEKRSRPAHGALGHTAFLTLLRKIK